MGWVVPVYYAVVHWWCQCIMGWVVPAVPVSEGNAAADSPPMPLDNTHSVIDRPSCTALHFIALVYSLVRLISVNTEV